MSQPIRLIRKTVWSDIFLIRIFFWLWSEKNFGRKKFLVGNFFLVGKIFGRKKLWSEKKFGPKSFGPKKILVGKKFWSENLFGRKIKFGPKIFLGQQNF